MVESLESGLQEKELLQCSFVKDKTYENQYSVFGGDCRPDVDRHATSGWKRNIRLEHDRLNRDRQDGRSRPGCLRRLFHLCQLGRL